MLDRLIPVINAGFAFNEQEPHLLPRRRAFPGSFLKLHRGADGGGRRFIRFGLAADPNRQDQFLDRDVPFVQAIQRVDENPESFREQVGNLPNVPGGGENVQDLFLDAGDSGRAVMLVEFQPADFQAPVLKTAKISIRNGNAVVRARRQERDPSINPVQRDQQPRLAGDFGEDEIGRAHV